MNDDSIKIFVCAHKKFEMNLPAIYETIQVGAIDKKDLGYTKDSTGDNISELNSSFCELTGLYWIWKNTQYNIVGLVHYRRYFFNNLFDVLKRKVLSEKKIKKILKKYDIILPQKSFFNKTTKEIYKDSHNIKDWELVGNVISEKYPEYRQAYDIISDSKFTYLLNMFCCKKEVIDEYCEWLFEILFYLKDKININEYDNYNKRIFGFISERLFNIWILKNDFKIKEKLVLNVEEKNIFCKYIKVKIKNAMRVFEK